MPEKPPPRRVLRFIRETPWAILPSVLHQIEEVVQFRAAGHHLSHEEIAARLDAINRPPSSSAVAPGSIAVIPISGPLSPKMDLMTEISGGSSYESITSAFLHAVADPNVSGILFDVDSPGGSVAMLEETADAIFKARGTKPIFGVVNTFAASAAYCLLSQVDEIYASPSSQLAGIGIITCHDYMAKAAEMAGMERTYITAPKGGNKAEGNPYEPLSADTLAYMQSMVDDYYNVFVACVARGRGVKPALVKTEEWGMGRVYTARAAVALGMADRVGTLQDAIDRLVKRKGRPGGARAEESMPLVSAEGVELQGDEEAAVPADIEAADALIRTRAKGRLALARVRRTA
jgi:signal peptide peptidase SppA